jgi:hypothetical protein
MSNETLQKFVEKTQQPIGTHLNDWINTEISPQSITDLTISKIRINYVIIWLLRARLKISTLFPEWGWGVVVGGGGGGWWDNHMSIQYANQSESLSWYITLHERIAQSNSCHKSSKGHVWQLNGILLQSVWTGVGIYFLIDIWCWVKNNFEF